MARSSSTSSSSGELRLLAGKLLVLLALVFVLDRAIGSAAALLYARTRDGDTGGTINALLERRREVLIFGSSRAESHYIPRLLNQALGTITFNAGFKGSNSLYDYGLEQLVFDHYTPKVIVYDYSAYSVDKVQGDPYDKLYPLYPYWRDPHVWELIRNDGIKAEWPFLSRIYPYNSKIHSLLIFNIIKSRPGADDGYDPNFTTMSDEPIQPLENDPYDAVLVTYLERFIDAAHERGVRVIFLESPRRSTGSFPIPAGVQQRIARYGIPVIDFSLAAYPQFRDHRLFRDSSHLNNEGATEFSRLLGKQLHAML